MYIQDVQQIINVGTEQPIINALKYQQIVFISRQFYNFKLLANKNHPFLKIIDTQLRK